MTQTQRWNEKFREYFLSPTGALGVKMSSMCHVCVYLYIMLKSIKTREIRIELKNFCSLNLSCTLFCTFCCALRRSSWAARIANFYWQNNTIVVSQDKIWLQSTMLDWCFVHSIWHLTLTCFCKKLLSHSRNFHQLHKRFWTLIQRQNCHVMV